MEKREIILHCLLWWNLITMLKRVIYSPLPSSKNTVYSQYLGKLRKYFGPPSSSFKYVCTFNSVIKTIPKHKVGITGRLEDSKCPFECSYRLRHALPFCDLSLLLLTSSISYQILSAFSYPLPTNLHFSPKKKFMS